MQFKDRKVSTPICEFSISTNQKEASKETDQSQNVEWASLNHCDNQSGTKAREMHCCDYSDVDSNELKLDLDSKLR